MQRLRQLIGLTLISIAIFALLIILGTFDPRPIGHLQRQWPSTTISVDDDSEMVHWLTDVPPRFSIRGEVTANVNPDYTEKPDAYALIVGEPSCWFAVAIDSTSGFLSIWREVNGEREIVESWHTWAHVKPQPTHELWMDVADGQLNLRINRERYGEALPLGCDVIQVGFWSTSTIVMHKIALFFE